MRIWAWIESLLIWVWVSVKWLIEKIWKPISLLIILVAVWFGFLTLVHRPPLNTTPILIMVWASALVLILAVYPNILERIKGLKIGDFEIELQDIVQTSSKEDFISYFEFDSEYFLTQKGSLNSLRTILSKAVLERNKPILLVANLRGDQGEERISIPMLLVYLITINTIGNSVIVLFVSSTRRSDRLQSISRFKKHEVLGLISGNVLIRQLYQHFPNLIRLWSQQGVSRNINNQDNLFDINGFVRIPSQQFIQNMYQSIKRIIDNGNNNFASEYLTTQKVSQWFGENLSKQAINSLIGPDDINTIKKILLDGDEFFLVVEGNNLETIVITCSFTNNLSKKVVNKLSKENN